MKSRFEIKNGFAGEKQREEKDKWVGIREKRNWIKIENNTDD